MQIRPHYPCVNTRSCVHQMVVVVPVCADSLKTPNINKEYRKHRYKRGERSISRHPYTENRDSDNDGHHSIAECFESCRSHYVYSTRKPFRLASTRVEIRERAPCRRPASRIMGILRFQHAAPFLIRVKVTQLFLRRGLASFPKIPHHPFAIIPLLSLVPSL